MLKADLHVHSLASPCGLHTVLELIAMARELGLRLMAITDHDEEPGTTSRVFSYRFPKRYQGLDLLAGMEFSIRDGGQVQVPSKLKIRDLDLGLAGFHRQGRSAESDPVSRCEELEAALADHPFIDIITHPCIQDFSLEPVRAARLAKRHGVALELNNCALRYGKERAEQVKELLAAARQARCLVCLNSDTHAVGELGGDELTRPLLEEAGIGAEYVLNLEPARVLDFVEERRPAKKAFD